MIKVHALILTPIHPCHEALEGGGGVDGQCMSDCPVRVIID